MFLRQRGKREWGQGLVEFAMVLPLLLLLLVGMAEFARILAIYSSLFNAAREGTRYGVVHPLDESGILSTARGKIVLIDPMLADTSVHFDSGPGTATKDAAYLTVGDRVIVRIYYDIEPMVPLLKPLFASMYVETEAARTVSALGDGAFPDPAPAIPTPTLLVTETPTPTVTVTTTPVPDTTIEINTPLHAGDTTVTGTAYPGQTVQLRDIQNPALNLSTVVAANGRFTFTLRPDQALVAGHVIVVLGYGKSDWAIVEGVVTPTITPTATWTPTATPTPGDKDIRLSPTCCPQDGGVLTVYGYNWPDSDVKIVKHSGQSSVEIAYIRKQDFDVNFTATINLSALGAGPHSIEALYKSGNSFVLGDQETLTVCAAPPTPTMTPTPSFPNLIVERVALANGGRIATHQPVTFTVSVRNIGQMTVNNLFWVDLYIDPTSPISPTNPLAQESADWTAVSSLEISTSIALTLCYRPGFTTTGQHVAYVMADTWDQVAEDNELDNVSTPLTITVAEEGELPTPTPTATPASIPNGSISGSTMLYIPGDVVSQGRVNVYCYQGATLIAETLSSQEGDYALPDIPPGTYTVIGEAVINNQLYTDVMAGVTVESGQETPYVTLILH